MRTIFKILLAIFGIAVFSSLSLRVSAAEANSYKIGASEDKYILYYADGTSLSPITESESLSYLVEYIGSGEVYFENIKAAEALIISGGAYTFKGSLSLSGGGMELDGGGTLALSELTLSLADCQVRIKEGRAEVGMGTSVYSNSSAFISDYSSRSELVVNGGSVVTDSLEPALTIKLGSIEISGGAVQNSLGAAIKNSGSMSISGAPSVSGYEYGVITDTPITLKVGSTPYLGSLRVKYEKSFPDGSMTPVFYKASAESIEGVALYDIGGALTSLTAFSSYSGMTEKDFCAVYKPYTFSFFDDGVLVRTEKILTGETVTPQSPSEQIGYASLGWAESEGSAIPYDFAQNVNKSMNFYAIRALLLPEFSISSATLVYDGQLHNVGISALSHPFEEEGEYSFAWYKNGVQILERGQTLAVSSVSDSGSYYAKITFTHGKSSVTVTTPSVNITVDKMLLSLPSISSVIYTGEPQAPEISNAEYFTVKLQEGTNVGKYKLILTLKDKINTAFAESDGESVELTYEILAAVNKWTVLPEIKNVYEGFNAKPSASSLFGVPKFLYSREPDGEYTENTPDTVGDWYMKAVVSGTENYSSLESEPISFSVLSELPIGLTVKNPPEKTSYTAFESFDASGLILTVYYNSGRSEDISGSDAAVEYMSAGNFRFGDTSLTLHLGGVSVSLSITVKKAVYDISGVELSSSTAVYSGMLTAPEFSGELPVGLDGIPLTATVIGAGVNSGSYTVSLSFSSESRNYELPKPITAEFVILPREAEVVWSGLSHIYDGTQKVPSAYYIDINGVQIPLTVYGGRSYAGEYSAVAAGEDSNYKLTGASCIFRIERAELDLSGLYWSIGEFIYDGEVHTVSVSGLPSGVSAVGYSNNAATNAGAYTAEVTLSYDTANYNPPPRITCEWQIKRAEYDSSGFEFSDAVCVFDGNTHYPSLIGSMPTGKDGIALEYEFSVGATHVSDGTVTVDVVFKSESTNYNIPTSITRDVKITPAPITVTWSNLTLKFNTGMQYPKAESPLTSVTVIGGGREAGEYSVTAVSDNSDYVIVNNSVLFTIEKAKNSWAVSPSASNVFYGGKLNLGGVALAGEVYFEFYSDPECTLVSEEPSAVGVYYVIIRSKGDSNYEPIASNPLSFEIVRIVPVGIAVSIKSDTLYAFDSLSENDFDAWLLNNDASRTPIYSGVAVIYQNGSSLRRADEYASFSYGGFSCTVEISVLRADYDLSSVKWSNGSFVYDGAVHEITVSGLPEGVKIKYYKNNRATVAGAYSATAVLLYDTENYNEPIIPSGTLEIKKCVITLPSLPDITYSATDVLPTAPDGELYILTADKARYVGEYSALLTVKDFNNYSFEGGAESAEVKYRIVPRIIKVNVSSVKKYLLSPMEKPYFTVPEGEILSGDTVDIVLVISDGMIYAVTENKNYELDVTAGNIERINALHPDTVFWGALIFVFLVLLLLLLWFLLSDRHFIKAKLAKLKCRLSYAREGNGTPPPPAPIISSPTSGAEAARSPIAESVSESEGTLSVDVEHADNLITDSLARDLIRREDTVIYTDGKRKRIINVDTLSESFAAGERVDVNTLKEHHLIPYDTAYIKVLARGTMNKPLYVYANDFSLSAVKMIALTGGEAIRVITMPRDGECDSRDKDLHD